MIDKFIWLMLKCAFVLFFATAIIRSEELFYDILRNYIFRDATDKFSVWWLLGLNVFIFLCVLFCSVVM